MKSRHLDLLPHKDQSVVEKLFSKGDCVILEKKWVLEILQVRIEHLPISLLTWPLLMNLDSVLETMSHETMGCMLASIFPSCFFLLHVNTCTTPHCTSGLESLSVGGEETLDSRHWPWSNLGFVFTNVSTECYDECLGVMFVKAEEKKERGRDIRKKDVGRKESRRKQMLIW